MRNKQSVSRGFTLVEVLVVIAILSILAGLLFSIFSSARGNARKAQCASNLKQIGLAWQMYADDCDGKIMPFSNTVGGNNQTWAGVQSTKGDGIARRTGLLHPWMKNDQILRCPSWAKDSASSFAVADIQGYGYNSTVFRSQNDANPDRTTSLSSIVKPAEMAVFADAAIIASPKTDPSLIAYLSISAPSSNIPSFHGRHNGFGNVLWADGHVKAMRPAFIDTRRTSVQLQESFGVGFINEDGKLSTDEFFELNTAGD